MFYSWMSEINCTKYYSKQILRYGGWLGKVPPAPWACIGWDTCLASLALLASLAHCACSNYYIVNTMESILGNQRDNSYQHVNSK
jgi:hypothetical protein